MIEYRFDNPKTPKYVGIRGERYVYANYYEQEPDYKYLHDLEKDPDYQEILVNMRSQAKATESDLK